MARGRARTGMRETARTIEQEVEATYSYHDASSQVAFEVVRFVFKQVGGGYVTDARGKRTKTFRQRRPSGESDQSWLWGLEAGEFMRRAPGKNWARFDAAKYEQYPAGKERKVFNTAAPVIPFRLPELLAALAGGQTICIAEGEKKVDRIRGLGFPRPAAPGARRSGGPSTPHSCKAPTLCCCRTMTPRGVST